MRRPQEPTGVHDSSTALTANPTAVRVRETGGKSLPFTEDAKAALGTVSAREQRQCPHDPRLGPLPWRHPWLCDFLSWNLTSCF